jgi:membrane protease YdiL (CAAX protease family)
MKSFIEPLILYWVLFFRFSSGTAFLGEPVVFSASAEAARIIMYNIPSLALVWYLLIRAKGLKEWRIGFKEWGIALPRKNDIACAALAFPALFLIGLTISLISPYFEGIPAGPRFLPPAAVHSWVILVLSCLSGAYLEESFFRFYLLSKREEMGLGPHRAVLVSTLMFSLCHIYEGPWGFLNAALSGVLLAFIFLRFKSLHGISIAHALYNIVVYAVGAIQ